MIKRIPYKITEYPGGFGVELPRNMINELIALGGEAGDHDRFADSLEGFRDYFDRDLAIELLDPYGSWYDDSVDTVDELATVTIQNILLWVIAGNHDEHLSCTPTHITCYIGD